LYKFHRQNWLLICVWSLIYTFKKFNKVTIFKFSNQSIGRYVDEWLKAINKNDKSVIRNNLILISEDFAHTPCLNFSKWKKKWPPIGRRHLTDHPSAKMKIPHRGPPEKNSKIQNGRHPHRTLYRKSWLKG